MSIILSSCGNDNNEPKGPVIPPAPQQADRTVLAYVAADNTLSRFALEDLSEMVEGMAEVDTDKNNLLVYIDSSSGTPQLYWLRKNDHGQVEKMIIMDYEKRNSVGVTEMKEVISYVYNTYKANSYGFIYWSHGDGWIPYPLNNARWVGQDVSEGDNRMNISQFKEVLDVAPHLDFLMFDACFMQSIEVAYELKECADYILASPTEIPGPGAPYQVLMPVVFNKNDNSAISIAASYYDFYEAKYKGGTNNSNSNWTGGVSMSVIETSVLNEFAQHTKNIFANYYNVSVNINNIMNYDRRPSKYYYDLDGYIKNLTNGNSDYSTWKLKFNKMQPYFKTTPRNFSSTGGMFSMDGSAGISTFIIQGSNQVLQNNYKGTAWAIATGLDKLIN